MKKLFIYLFISFVSYFQTENYLDTILALEPKLSKEKFLDTILTIEYEKALTDTKKYLILCNKAEKIALVINNQSLLAKSYIAKSLALHFSSKHENSIAYTLKAIEIYEQSNNTENSASLYTALGWQIKNNDLSKALYYMNKGITILEKTDTESTKLIAAFNNYGVLKQRKNELDSAYLFHKKSLDLSLKKNDSLAIPFAQTHIGEVFVKKKDFSTAEKYFIAALEIRKKRNDIYGITDSYLYLGDLFYAKKNYKKAIFYFKKGEELAVKNSYFPLKKYASEYIYKSYQNLQDYKNAFEYQTKFNLLKDSILNTETNSKIAELEIKYQTTEKEKEIAQQKEELLAQELAIKNRNLYAILLTSTLLILGIIFIGLYK
ncbi:MAG: tetratricopeptide repeat protein, partial [Polaribacter sp.]|uniref:tetratricopeptide repeat protein n=1 Tax=Polaribacter sp. TaxID=1920175 RepID=UPI003BB1388A